MSSTLLPSDDSYSLSPSPNSSILSVKPEPPPSPELPSSSSRNLSSHQPILWFEGVGSSYNNPTISPSQYWDHRDENSASPEPVGLSHTLPLLHANSFDDEYDKATGVANGVGGLLVPSNLGPGERPVRRRSSKACDQCRKSKCKCERASSGEPCKNCIMLGAPCTFLGPSRKRGPPKGYIDAIEARLHQAEALLGIMLASGDSRADTLLNDISQDPLAREIINRVDNSSYGVKGRSKDTDRPNGTKSRFVSSADEKLQDELMSTHPTNEWQDCVTEMLRNRPRGRSPPTTESKQTQPPLPVKERASSAGYDSHGRRQRKKMNNCSGDAAFISASAPVTATSTPVLSATLSRSVPSRTSSPQHHLYPASSERPASHALEAQFRAQGSITSVSSDGYTSGSDDEEVVDAIGQLSLNEEEQIRFHGKASGLHILGSKARADRRNEGGIWRLPEVRVWPSPSQSSLVPEEEDELGSKLPSQHIQDELIETYFDHSAKIRPSPYIHDSPIRSSDSDHISPSAPSSSKSRPDEFPLFSFLRSWSAGDSYLEHAQAILSRSYTQSRPSTCQALLLLGYRQAGVGATASAWTYVGMAIRMAQDLGMHRQADRWAREGMGGQIFESMELQERKRIWYSCVVMDKYVSAYIGRPLMIFESDFDTLLPSEELEYEDVEELGSNIGHPIPCFKAAATLSGFLGTVLQTIYAARPASSRHGELALIDGLLNKWYYGLPANLQHDPQSLKSSVPPPCVLTLHMQYWCTMLLLHRPFTIQERHRPSGGVRLQSVSDKNHELCASAANHITSIATLFLDKYTLRNCPAFLCYYVFTASLMHIVSISSFPNDPQASIGLNKCLNILNVMQVTWPSAGRALELLKGSKVNFDVPVASPPNAQKRPLESSGEIEARPESRPVPIFNNAHLPPMDNYDLPHHPEFHNPYSQSNMQLVSIQSPPAPYYTASTLHRSWSDNQFDSLPTFSGNNDSLNLPQTYHTVPIDNRHTLSGSHNHHRQPLPNHHLQHHLPTSSSSNQRQLHHQASPYWNEFAFRDLGGYDAGNVSGSPSVMSTNGDGQGQPLMMFTSEPGQYGNQLYGKSTLSNLARHVTADHSF
ncbi:hypothetical protein D9757_012319 [Collybiopsis confluens]|uniref:Zn(2)-C6 fungal-type domain-containing protein n=1 Tax=Collybiopsis confluens TaxID=2823264 RepID=A0A8H5LL87_9AGAR|nr:hypothetical protein D9757_012319 [Collybiopsis confluens]